MKIIAVGRKTCFALAALGMMGPASPLWAGSASAQCCSSCGQGAVKSSAAAPAASDAKPAAPQTTCPIMGGKIDKKVFTDFKGKRVYFCCAGCVGKFLKGPAKYIKAMEDAGIVLGKAPQPPAALPAPSNPGTIQQGT